MSIPTRDAIDLNEFLNSAKDEICSVISNELNDRKVLKFYFISQFRVGENLGGWWCNDNDPVSAQLAICSFWGHRPRRRVSDSLGSFETFTESLPGRRVRVLSKICTGMCRERCELYVVGGSSFIELPANIKNEKSNGEHWKTLTNYFFCTVCRMYGNP